MQRKRQNVNLRLKNIEIKGRDAMDITNFVTKLVRKHGTSNPFKIAKEKGIIILEMEMGKINGYYRKCNNIKMIYINSELEENKKLFTCCHELGHAILHPDEPALSLGINSNRIKIESEANEFATKLLLHDKDEYLYESKYQLLHAYGIEEEMERYI